MHMPCRTTNAFLHYNVFDVLLKYLTAAAEAVVEEFVFIDLLTLVTSLKPQSGIRETVAAENFSFNTMSSHQYNIN